MGGGVAGLRLLMTGIYQGGFGSRLDAAAGAGAAKPAIAAN